MAASGATYDRYNSRTLEGSRAITRHSSDGRSKIFVTRSRRLIHAPSRRSAEERPLESRRSIFPCATLVRSPHSRKRGSRRSRTPSPSRFTPRTARSRASPGNTATQGAVFPGLALLLAVLGVNLLGDGVRDLLDPRFRE